MAKGKRGGRKADITLTAPVTSAGASISNAPQNATQFTHQDAQQLRSDVDDMYDADVVDAIKMYISKNQTSTGYSISQNLNYKLDNGLALDPTEKFIDDNIQAGMHSIGKDIQLQRFAHDDILQAMGISDYTKMTDKQLQSALVGTTFQTTAYLSTSYDGKNSPFHPNQPLGGGREVVMNIKAGKNTQIVFGARQQSEMVLNKGTNFKVTGIHFDGTTAHPRVGGAKPRVVLDIETF